MLTWMGDVRPRKLTIWVAFEVESESEVKHVQFLHPNLEISDKRSLYNNILNCFWPYLADFSICQGYPVPNLTRNIGSSNTYITTAGWKRIENLHDLMYNPSTSMWRLYKTYIRLIIPMYAFMNNCMSMWISYKNPLQHVQDLYETSESLRETCRAFVQPIRIHTKSRQIHCEPINHICA